MNLKQYKVPSIWKVEFEPHKPSISFLVPVEIFKYIVHKPVELMTFMDFGHMEKFTDPENDRKLIAFRKNLPANSSKDFERIKKWMEISFGVFASAVGEDLVINFDFDSDFRDMDRFWRVLLRIDKAIMNDLDPVEINCYDDVSTHGAHTRVQEYDEYGVIRIKSRTLDDLRDRFNKAINSIINQL